MPDELKTAQEDVVFDPFSPAIKDPKFIVADHLGNKRAYDYFEISKNLEQIQGKGKSLAAQVDQIRQIFGYPTADEVAANPELKTPSPNTTLAMLQAFMEKFEGLEVIKKLAGQMPPLSATASNPANSGG